MKTITIASVADRLNCNLSVARRAIRQLLEKKAIQPIVLHSKYYLCTRLHAKEGEVQEEAPAKGAKKQK